MSMQRWVAASVLVSVALLEGSSRAAQRQVVFVNRLEVAIGELHLSEPGRDAWGDDLLVELLAPKASVELTISVDDSTCVRDVMASTEGQGEQVWRALDLCKVSTVVLEPAGVVSVK